MFKTMSKTLEEPLTGISHKPKPKLDSARRLAFSGVLLVLFLSSFNLTVVGTVLPKVVSELGGMHLYAWVFTAYSLATTVSIPIFGRLSDIYSRRNMLLWGILLFALGSTGIALVQNMPQLIALRALQGIGGGALMGLSFAALADIFEPKEQSKYQGVTGSIYGISSLLGPPAGGLIADLAGWRWVFPLNLPLALVAFWVIWRYLPKNEAHPNTHIDFLGAGLLIAGLVPLLTGLSLLPSLGLAHLAVWGQLLGGAVVLGSFAWWQTRSPGPILQPSLFRNPVFAISTVAMLLSTSGLYAGILYLPLYMQAVKGMSAAASGMILSPFMLGTVITSTISGMIISRTGRYKGLILSGLVIMAVALIGSGQLAPETPVWLALTLSTLLGLGLGPVNPVFNLIVQQAVPKHEIGSAMGGLRFFNQMGGTLGATLFGLVMSHSLLSQGKIPAPPELPSQVITATASTDILTNAPLLQQLQSQLHSAAQWAAYEHVLHGLRVLMSLSLDQVFLTAAIFAGLAFGVTLLLPPALLKE